MEHTYSQDFIPLVFLVDNLLWVLVPLTSPPFAGIWPSLEKGLPCDNSLEHSSHYRFHTSSDVSLSLQRWVSSFLWNLNLPLMSLLELVPWNVPVKCMLEHFTSSLTWNITSSCLLLQNHGFRDLRLGLEHFRLYSPQGNVPRPDLQNFHIS